MDLITVVGMGMQRDGAVKTLVHDIPDEHRFPVHQKGDIAVRPGDPVTGLIPVFLLRFLHAIIITQDLR